MTVTLATPCNSSGRWQTTDVGSNRAQQWDFCGQCFPDGWETVTEKDIETFLYTWQNGSKLHRSIDTGDDADCSNCGNHDYPDRTLAAQLANDEVTLDHEFEYDQQHSGGGV